MELATNDPGSLVTNLQRKLLDAERRLESITNQHRIAVEELHCRNSDLYSLNGELAQANRSLEKSNGEVQAMNEELQSLNAELALKVHEADEIGADMQNFYDSTQVATLLITSDLNIRAFTPAVTRFYRVLERDVGRKITDIEHSLRYDGLLDDVREVLTSLELCVRSVTDITGTEFYMLRILPYRSRLSVVQGAVITFLDVTYIVKAEQKQREAEAELARLSAYDPLTGLPNRRSLNDHMQAWRECKPRPAAALLFMDLDRFKTINDSLGHAAGDIVLEQVSKRLIDSVTKDCLICRIGGDEFVSFWPGASLAQAELLATRLVSALSKPVMLSGRMHYITASIGIASSATTSETDVLLREADTAMYVAKARGGNRFVVASPSFHTSVLADMQLEQDLFSALPSKQLTLRYQPLIDSASNKVFGCEALVRWQHPTKGWVAPNVFIPVAEKSGLIVSIGTWIIEEAIRQLSVLRQTQKDLMMSVNVSPTQLIDGIFIEILRSALSRYDVPASAVCIEVTEGTFLSDAARLEIAQIRALGSLIAIDDFGSGFSSLSYLQELSVDIVKIDRAFISPLGQSARADAFFTHIVGLAQTLGLKTVAEGCETLEQRRIIAESHCDFVQGFFISSPLTVEELTKSGIL